MVFQCALNLYQISGSVADSTHPHETCGNIPITAPVQNSILNVCHLKINSVQMFLHVSEQKIVTR